MTKVGDADASSMGFGDAVASFHNVARGEGGPFHAVGPFHDVASPLADPRRRHPRHHRGVFRTGRGLADREPGREDFASAGMPRYRSIATLLGGGNPVEPPPPLSDASDSHRLHGRVHTRRAPSSCWQCREADFAGAPNRLSGDSGPNWASRTPPR